MKKLLLLLLSSVLLLSTTNAVWLAKVNIGTQKCYGLQFDSGDYPADVAEAVAIALGYQTYIENPSAIFLTGNAQSNIRAWGLSFGATKCYFSVF